MRYSSNGIFGSKSLSPKLAPFIRHFLKPYKRFVCLFTLLAMWTGFWGPLNSLLLKFMIDSLSLDSMSGALTLVLPGVLLVANFEIHNLCWRGIGYLNYRFQGVIKNQLIRETFDYVHGHTHQFFLDHLAGRLSNQITTLADNVENIVHNLSPQVIRGVTMVLVALVSMFFVHATFFWALLIWLLIFSIVSLTLSKRIVALSADHANQESTVAGQLVDSMSNANNVRMFARRDYELSHLEGSLSQARNAFQKKQLFAVKLHLFQGSSLSIMLAFMVYYLIQLRQIHQVTIGDFALILGLAVEVGFITWWTLEQVDELNKAVGKCKQSLHTLFVPLEIVDQKDARSLTIDKGEIKFENVKFHYKGNDALFENKSITIEAGQKVGLVGYSGSGKSTFVSLIMRFYDVTQGRILIDGQDISNVAQDSLRSKIALIPQDPTLFHRSLMENLRYGRIEATDEEIMKAARQAHAHEFINQLPEKYETLVGERGVKLSGGQRQRIAIARAFVKNAPVLILDEATSQLDSITETLIQDSLMHLMEGKTTIVIAHRLSTLLHMDRILVFDHGRIVGDGTHGQLLISCPLYKTLWAAQIGGFLTDGETQQPSE